MRIFSIISMITALAMWLAGRSLHSFALSALGFVVGYIGLAIPLISNKISGKAGKALKLLGIYFAIKAFADIMWFIFVDTGTSSGYQTLLSAPGLIATFFFVAAGHTTFMAGRERFGYDSVWLYACWLMGIATALISYYMLISQLIQFNDMASSISFWVHIVDTIMTNSSVFSMIFAAFFAFGEIWSYLLIPLSISSLTKAFADLWYVVDIDNYVYGDGNLADWLWMIHIALSYLLPWGISQITHNANNLQEYLDPLTISMKDVTEDVKMP